jgi:hypothetical protein
VKGPDGIDCSIPIEPIKDDPNNAKQREREATCKAWRCRPENIWKAETNYFDEEYNPDGTLPVISFCDGKATGEGSYSLAYGGPGEKPMNLALAVDLNKNGVRDEGEPQREATVEWTGPDAPQFATEVNVRPTQGRVLIRLPRGAAVKGKWAHAAQSRFVRLTEAKQVPVGAEMNVKRGTVSLTSSKGPTGGVQTSQFYSGRFVVRQPRRERGMTEMRLSEPMKCTPNTRRGKVVASAVRTRRLWGRGRGRFRTRGRNSSATVRGTTWLQKDTCTTTTTIVRDGTVIVKDFAKRKNVRVKAPRRHVARARRR